MVVVIGLVVQFVDKQKHILDQGFEQVKGFGLGHHDAPGPQGLLQPLIERLLKKHLRRADRVGTVHDDEIVVLFPGRHETGAVFQVNCYPRIVETLGQTGQKFPGPPG